MINDQFQEIGEYVETWLNANEFQRVNEFGYEHYLRSGTSNLFHRECGPARYCEDLFEVSEEYWLHGNRHREDGPAIIQYEGSPIKFEPTMTTADRISEYMRHAHTCDYEWYWQDMKHTFKDWLALTDISESEQALLLLKHG